MFFFALFNLFLSFFVSQSLLFFFFLVICYRCLVSLFSVFFLSVMSASLAFSTHLFPFFVYLSNLRSFLICLLIFFFFASVLYIVFFLSLFLPFPSIVPFHIFVTNIFSSSQSGQSSAFRHLFTVQEFLEH